MSAHILICENKRSFPKTNGTFDMQFKFPLTVQIYWNLICVECFVFNSGTVLCSSVLRKLAINDRFLAHLFLILLNFCAFLNTPLYRHQQTHRKCVKGFQNHIIISCVVALANGCFFAFYCNIHRGSLSLTMFGVDAIDEISFHRIYKTHIHIKRKRKTWMCAQWNWKYKNAVPNVWISFSAFKFSEIDSIADRKYFFFLHHEPKFIFVFAVCRFFC